MELPKPNEPRTGDAGQVRQNEQAQPNENQFHKDVKRNSLEVPSQLETSPRVEDLQHEARGSSELSIHSQRHLHRNEGKVVSLPHTYFFCRFHFCNYRGKPFFTALTAHHTTHITINNDYVIQHHFLILEMVASKRVQACSKAYCSS